jgi:hypothetical protein
MQVGQPVPQPILTKRHNVCHPASAADTSLADFDYERNGGTRTVTVIAHYFSGCTPGRDDAPLYNRMAELYLSQGKPVAFVTSLKNGVNDGVAEAFYMPPPDLFLDPETVDTAVEHLEKLTAVEFHTFPDVRHEAVSQMRYANPSASDEHTGVSRPCAGHHAQRQ